jgi:flavin reductase (DIM6/NTAB) family NADH-FMN oxidoreductase RutF
MDKLDCMAVVPAVMGQIKNRGGAFLNVQAGDDVNVMTIGWASIGILWGRQVMTVMVRKTRFSFGIMERARDFTVNVPTAGMEKELEFCGTKSGRTYNKYEKCGLELFPSVKVHTPIVVVPGVIFECRTVYKSAVEPAALADDYRALYPEKDYHTLYYGEIKECYSIKGER